MAATDPWQWASARSAEFNLQAAAYDQHRPRYPEELFDTLVETLGTGAMAIDIGAGTGIASEPLANRGLRVVAIEPARAMADIARLKLGGRGEVVVARFEEWTPSAPADLVAAFSSWHWVDPSVGLEKVAAVLRPGGVFALVWTEVVQFGQEPFDQRARLSVPPHSEHIEPHLRRIDAHGAFGDRLARRFRFDVCSTRTASLPFREPIQDKALRSGTPSFVRSSLSSVEQ